jgi:hypothetical protein
MKIIIALYAIGVFCQEEFRRGPTTGVIGAPFFGASGWTPWFGPRLLLFLEAEILLDVFDKGIVDLIVSWNWLLLGQLPGSCRCRALTRGGALRNLLL